MRSVEPRSLIQWLSMSWMLAVPGVALFVGTGLMRTARMPCRDGVAQGSGSTASAGPRQDSLYRAQVEEVLPLGPVDGELKQAR